MRPNFRLNSNQVLKVLTFFVFINAVLFLKFAHADAIKEVRNELLTMGVANKQSFALSSPGLIVKQLMDHDMNQEIVNEQEQVENVPATTQETKPEELTRAISNYDTKFGI